MHYTYTMYLNSTGICTYTNTVVHRSADRVLSFFFRLSRAKVGSITDDIKVTSLLYSLSSLLVKNYRTVLTTSQVMGSPKNCLLVETILSTKSSEVVA